MRVWLVKLGEPLPTDPGNPRLLRMGLLARVLVERGHQVTWWSSTMDHARKIVRAHSTAELTAEDGCRLILLDGPSYSKNVSLKRVLHHRVTAANFRKAAVAERRPDVIVCAFPTIEMALATTDFGVIHGIPTIIDIRDLWPDIYLDLVPTYLRPFARILLKPSFDNCRRAMRQASAVVAITDAILDWGLGHARRSRRLNDRCFPLAYSETPPSSEARADAEAFWSAKGVYADPNVFVVCFFGSFTPRSELITVLKAAELIPEGLRPKIKIVLCGDGAMFEPLRRASEGLPHVLLPGWVNHEQIWTLMRRASVGLLPYPSTVDFARSIPNKVGEYTSAGLPILSSVQGEMSRLIEEFGFGLTYPNRNAEELAKIFCRLMEDRALCARMSAQAAAFYAAFLKANQVYETYARHIEQVARGGSAASA